MERPDGVSRWLFFFLGVLCVVLLLSVTGLSAYTEADLEKVKTTKSCEQCNLRGANLSGLDLSGCNLSRAQLVGTQLAGANLSGANLTGANLIDANLSGANLAGADLSGARWTDGTVCKAGSVGECRK
jgi:uncharacterized protein YjbI with pentapeptide repeats